MKGRVGRVVFVLFFFSGFFLFIAVVEETILAKLFFKALRHFAVRQEGSKQIFLRSAVKVK